MATLDCPNCNNKVSPLAEKCPKCGHPVAAAARKAPAKIKRWPLILGGVVVLFVLGSFLGSEDKKPAETPETKTENSGTSSTDVADSANVDPCASVATIEDWNKASKAWRNKNPQCNPEGDIGNYSVVSPSTLFNEYEKNEVSADRKYKGNRVAISGSIYSIEKSFLGYPELVFDISQGIQTVRCQFPKSDEDWIADLRKGQRVTVIGTVEAFTLGIQLSIKDCMFPTKK